MIPTTRQNDWFSAIPVRFCDAHLQSYWVSGQDELLGFCGMCWLKNLFEAEVPKRLYEYDGIADNGNPQMHWEFLRHLEAQLGLIPPLPEQSLRSYRSTRGQYMRTPSRALPVSRALWKMMGFQPVLAKPLSRILCGMTEEDYAKANNMDLVDLRQIMVKAVRTALREIRKR